MNQDNNKSKMIKKIKKDLKPDLFFPVWNTIICSGPLLNLILRYFLVREIKNPTAAIILTVIAAIWVILIWYWYVKERNDFKKDWEKVSSELNDIDFQEKSSKDILGTILNILIITAISSLVMTIVSIVIALLTNLSSFKNLALFCLLLFLITAVVLIIIYIIFLFSFVRAVIKQGRLKKVLGKFILIYTLTFTILTIMSLTIHKNPEWIYSLLYSFVITFSIILYTEVYIFYKEMKQKYQSITPSDDYDDK